MRALVPGRDSSHLDGQGWLPGVVRSYVVTGGGQGIGRAIAERLLADGGAVVVLDRDQAVLGWTSARPAGRRVIPLAGDAADEAVTGRAADLAQDAGRLAGWVNNAAVFRDAWLDEASAAEITGLITANLALAVAGCAAAAPSPPAATRHSSPAAAWPPRTRKSRSAPCTPSAEPAAPPKQPTLSATCCQMRPASSTAPSAPSTAAGPPSAPTPSKPPDSSLTRPHSHNQ